MKLFVGAKGIVHYDNKVLLVRESTKYDEGTSAGQWDMVGGRIESDETVQQGLLREVKEESGLNVETERLIEVFDDFLEIKGESCHIVRLYFLCRADSDEVILSEDHDAYDWVDPHDVGDKSLMTEIPEMLRAAKELLA